MSKLHSPSVTAFAGQRLLASGGFSDVLLAVKVEVEQGSDATVLVFDDATGKVVDFDLRGSREDVLERFGRQVGGSRLRRDRRRLTMA